jgi:hypothetical protein
MLLILISLLIGLLSCDVKKVSQEINPTIIQESQEVCNILEKHLDKSVFTENEKLICDGYVRKYADKELMDKMTYIENILTADITSLYMRLGHYSDSEIDINKVKEDFNSVKSQLDNLKNVKK